jgi:hypothetical protein
MAFAVVLAASPRVEAALVRFDFAGGSYLSPTTVDAGASSTAITFNNLTLNQQSESTTTNVGSAAAATPMFRALPMGWWHAERQRDELLRVHTDATGRTEV